jgi:hypothetical protein
MARKKKHTTHRRKRSGRRIGAAKADITSILELVAGAAAGAAIAEFFTQSPILAADSTTGKGGLSMEQKSFITIGLGAVIPFLMKGNISMGLATGMAGNGVVNVLKKQGFIDNKIITGVGDVVIAGPSLQAVVGGARRLNGINAVVAGMPKPGGIKSTAGMY